MIIICPRISLGEDNIKKIIKEWKKITEERLRYSFIPPQYDPFKTITIKLKPAPLKENQIIYHKDYNLHELKLVGIVRTRNTKIAIIEDPKGRGLFLKTGNYLGKNGAVIIKITDCAVYIAQRYIDYKGKIILSPKPYKMSLSTEGNQCKE